MPPSKAIEAVGVHSIRSYRNAFGHKRDRLFLRLGARVTGGTKDAIGRMMALTLRSDDIAWLIAHLIINQDTRYLVKEALAEHDRIAAKMESESIGQGVITRSQLSQRLTDYLRQLPELDASISRHPAGRKR